LEKTQPTYITATMPTRIAARMTKAATKLDIENRVALEETPGGGAVAVRAVAVVADTVFEAAAELDPSEADAEALLDEAALSEDDPEDVVEEEEEDEVDFVEEEAVEVTVEVIVN
jgi:hypothetical protein